MKYNIRENGHRLVGPLAHISNDPATNFEQYSNSDKQFETTDINVAYRYLAVLTHHNYECEIIESNEDYQFYS